MNHKVNLTYVLITFFFNFASDFENELFSIRKLNIKLENNVNLLHF